MIKVLLIVMMTTVENNKDDDNDYNDNANDGDHVVGNINVINSHVNEIIAMTSSVI